MYNLTPGKRKNYLFILNNLLIKFVNRHICTKMVPRMDIRVRGKIYHRGTWRE